jgi:hypothetical protein
MSNLWINWRFGAWHLQIGPDAPRIRFVRNEYWDENKYPCWFERY